MIIQQPWLFLPICPGFDIFWPEFNHLSSTSQVSWKPAERINIAGNNRTLLLFHGFEI